jgi:hypothetical protein
LVWVARKVLRGEGEVPNLRRLEVTISKELEDWDYAGGGGGGGEEDRDGDLQQCRV